jgi:hypothetical protein
MKISILSEQQAFGVENLLMTPKARTYSAVVTSNECEVLEITYELSFKMMEKFEHI